MNYHFDDVKILVVEDNQPMLEITKTLLATFGVGTIVGAREGEEGFREYCELNPDIVIADWMMKPVDGISLARRIRNDLRSPNPYVPIILMTGFSEMRRVIQARDAGVTEFLVKPFTARDLYKRITQIIERPRQFVRSEDFFGPDRRRKASTDYSGPLRRETDVLKAYQQKERMKKASVELDTMRSNAGLTKGGKIDIKRPRDDDEDIIIDLK
jgi:two-component system chemotaxis response regulator CheY